MLTVIAIIANINYLK